MQASSTNPTKPVEKVIVTEILQREDFHRILELNPGLFIIKLGASWCAPCTRIQPMVHSFFASSPENVICADIDVDRCSDLYIYLKSKKMVNGIPAILMYKQGNTTFIPDDSVVGGDTAQLDAFFKRCGVALKSFYVRKRGTPAPRK